MLDVVVRSALQIGNHMRWHSIDGSDLCLLKLARSNELRIFGWNGDPLIGHTSLQEQRDMRIVQSRALGYEVTLESLVCFRFQGRRVLEHARHIASLIEEAFTVLLRCLRKIEVVTMYGNGALTFIAVGRESPQVDNIIRREHFSRRSAVIKHIIGTQKRLDLGRVL